MTDSYRWPGDNKTQVERAMSAEYELDKAVTEINALRAHLAMRNSDIQALVTVLTAILETDSHGYAVAPMSFTLRKEAQATLGAVSSQKGSS